MRKREKTNSLFSGGGYHWDHAHLRHRLHPHYLDFNNYPLPIKPYGGGVRIDLGGSVNGADHRGAFSSALFSRKRLSRVLFDAYGVTAAEPRGGIPLFQRVVPSAGGLYPCHLYLVLSRDSGFLETGVYYFDPVNFSLVQLRNKQGKVSSASGGGIGFIITAAYYNSTWKYRGRAYRYMLLDGGHLFQNLSLVLGRLGMEHQVEYDLGSWDAESLLGIDGRMEAVLGMVTVGWNKDVSILLDAVKNDTVPCFPELNLRREESLYMDGFRWLPKVHAACSKGCEVKNAVRMTVTADEPLDRLSLPPKRGAAPASISDLEKIIFRRRSRRNFSREPMAESLWQDLFSWIRPDGSTLAAELSYRFLRLGMICQNLEGLEEGFYLFSEDGRGLNLIKRGHFAPTLAAVCLDQAWIGRAAVTFLFMSDLDVLDTHYGPGGYRHMMLAAGRAAQNIYLGAAALGLGCCGIGAIYDYEAQDLLELTESSALVYAVSAGPVKKRAGHGN